MTHFGYVPYLRPGALLFSLAAFRYFQKGPTDRDSILADLYGSAGGGKRNLFGENVATLAKRVFGDSVPPSAVLLRHTFFGIYSRALSPAAASAWSDALIAGDRSLNARRALRASSHFHLVTRDLRSCPQCVDDDIEMSGFGQWRILHQIPALLCCPEHGHQLNNELRGRSGGILWRFALPQAGFSTFRDKIPLVASEGHSAYLEFWTQLFDGRLSVLTSHEWATYMDTIVAETGKLASATAEIEATIRRSWSTDLPNIKSALGSQIKDDFVRAELSHKSAPARIAQKLIVLGAASSLGIAPQKASESSQLRLDLSSTFKEAPELPLQERLRRFLLDSALPGALAPFLLSDRNTTQIAIDSGVHRRHVWRTMERIPDVLLKEIALTQEWPRRSWITIELQNRREKRPT